MMKNIDTVFRVFFALFLIAGYMAMAILEDLFLEETPHWKGIFAVCGLIVYIVAVATILVAHKNGGRSYWELILAFAAPYILYALLFYSFDWASGELWRFTGSFQFLSIAGGFILGIILSPLIAVIIGSYTGTEALDATVFGFRFIDSIGLKAFSAVLAAGFVAAFVFSAGVIVTEIRDLGIVKKILFYLLLLNSTALFAYYSFGMTRFAMGTRL